VESRVIGGLSDWQETNTRARVTDQNQNFRFIKTSFKNKWSGKGILIDPESPFQTREAIPFPELPYRLAEPSYSTLVPKLGDSRPVFIVKTRQIYI
jgi:hypothetical protein